MYEKTVSDNHIHKFCEDCGDCVECYGEDPCLVSSDGKHTYVPDPFMSLSQETPPSGLYKKYTVIKVNNDHEVDHCQPFVLLPTDVHARKAMLTYAKSIEDTNPELAQDLRHLVDRHRGTGESHHHGLDEDGNNG